MLFPFALLTPTQLDLQFTRGCRGEKEEGLFQYVIKTSEFSNSFTLTEANTDQFNCNYRIGHYLHGHYL